MSLELVVFDLAGTTIRDDNEVADVFNAALSDYELDQSVVTSVMGWPKPIAIGHLIGANPDSALVMALHDKFVQGMIEHYQSSLEPMPHAGELIEKLESAGIRTGIDTGFFRVIGQVILDKVNFPISASVMSDEVENGRPAPDMIYRLMELTGVKDAAKVAKVGDTPSDLRQGTAAGCGLVIGVLHGTHTREQLEKEPHTHLAEDLFEVEKILLG